MHNPLQLLQLSLTFKTKLCFQDFTQTIYPGDKIAIIGDNGTGKSSLLKIIASMIEFDGQVLSHNAQIAYVPQIITKYTALSGGQRFNKTLSQALAQSPDVLLLDEPTNHLDIDNRKSLIRMLKNNPMTQVIVSHDIDLINQCTNILWHIHDGQIRVFNGTYDMYQQELENDSDRLKDQVHQLRQVKKQQHESLMKEQQRAKNNRIKGEKQVRERKYTGIIAGNKAMNAENSAGKNKANLAKLKNQIDQQLSNLWEAEEISYSFNLNASIKPQKQILSIQNGGCTYSNGVRVFDNVNLSLYGADRLAVIGANGSGKSTLIKAILNDAFISKSGEWDVPSDQQIAYFDQHYATLPNNITVIAYITSLAPQLDHSEIRLFLNQFLFRKNDEVDKLIECLSGGEKVRLVLASIALTQPRLLVLDEITNNIDLRTRKHIVNVLKAYAGAMIIISHDHQFLTEIGISEYLNLDNYNY